MMSKKLMKETAESIDEIPAELGPALKMLGTVLQEEWMTRDGVYLPEDERKQNPEPIAFVDDSVISIRVGDKRITLRPSHSDKPALVIPVGMSDKKNTCSIPRDWLQGVWIDALIAAFDGDPSVALQFAARVNEAIDLAMITGEDGRQTVKQADLPSHRHAVEVAEITESLKRHFHGKSAGSPKVNMDFTIETIGSEPPVQEGLTYGERYNNVLNTLIPNPNVAQATPSSEVAAQDGSVVEASHPENPPLSVPATLEEDTVEHEASGESQTASEIPLVLDDGLHDAKNIEEATEIVESTLAEAIYDHVGVCANSGLPATFIVEDLPVGPRAFATEKDYCEYVGLEYKGEGYYGFTEPPLERVVDSEPVADAVSEAQEDNTPVEEQPSNDDLGFGGY